MTTETRLSVAELMTANVVTANKEDMLNDTIRTMETESISALPVVDSNGKICGILSNSDLVRLTYNLQCDLSTLSVVSDTVRRTLLDVLAEDNCDTKVSDAMTTSVETISPSAKIVEAAQTMVNNDIHHLPVVDNSGQSVGIVSTLDIVRAVAFQM